MSYVLNYYDDREHLAYTVNLSNDTTTPKINYVLSNRTDSSCVEGIPMKLLSLGYRENKEDFEFPWRREDISLRVSMRASGADVIVKREGRTSSKNEDKTASFYVPYTVDTSEFRRLLLESEIKVSS